MLAGSYGGDLLRAYAGVGRVEGALARAAERVRTRCWSGSGRACSIRSFVRLVRLGDTAGATRRVSDASRVRRRQMGAGPEARQPGRQAPGAARRQREQPTAEIAHEALVTAWSYFQALLQDNAAPKRVLDNLIPRAPIGPLRRIQENVTRGGRSAPTLSCSLGCSSSGPTGSRRTNGDLSGNRSGWPTRRPSAN